MVSFRSITTKQISKPNMKLRKQSRHCKQLGHYIRKQKGGFLNRYNFVYAVRDTASTVISQLNRIAPGLIRKTSIEIDHIAQRRIQQAINQGGKEIEFVAPKIIM